MIKRGLYPGRFQPFHLGHLNAIKNILKECDELIIVIGSAQYSHLADNPFTAGERLYMIRRSLEENNIDVSRIWLVPVPDLHLHMMWVSVVEGYTPPFDVVFSNEPLTRRLFTERGYEVAKLPFYKRNVLSSTQIRKMILNRDNWESYVPKTVAAFVKSIDGVNRLQALTLTDKGDSVVSS